MVLVPPLAFNGSSHAVSKARRPGRVLTRPPSTSLRAGLKGRLFHGASRWLCENLGDPFHNGGLVRLRKNVLAALLLGGSIAAQNVVHYTTTNANVKYLFATAEPVLHLKPGDILDTNTLDCFGNGLKKPGDTLDMAKGDNPLAGPFYIEGAEPGDTLAVKILDLQVDGDYGVGAFSPGLDRLTRRSTRQCWRSRRGKSGCGFIPSIMGTTRRRSRRWIRISR